MELWRMSKSFPFRYSPYLLRHSRCSGTRASGRVVLLPFSDPFYSALYTDSCLYIVPHSHKTVRTPEQRRLSETLDPPQNPLTMLGAICLTLQRKWGMIHHFQWMLNLRSQLERLSSIILTFYTVLHTIRRYKERHCMSVLEMSGAVQSELAMYFSMTLNGWREMNSGFLSPTISRLERCLIIFWTCRGIVDKLTIPYRVEHQTHLLFVRFHFLSWSDYREFELT